MSLTFGALGSDRVDVGSDTSIDNLNPYSVWKLVNPTTFTTGRIVMAQGTPGGANRRIFFSLFDTGGNLANTVDRTTDTTYSTNSAPIGTGSWQKLGLTYASASTPTTHIYSGTLTGALAEATYGTNTDGSGTPADPSAVSVIIGNSSAAAAAFQGVLGFVALASAEMTSAAGEVLLNFPYLARVTTGVVAAWSFIAGLARDHVGVSNGTVTGATASTHVPKITDMAMLNACGCA